MLGFRDFNVHINTELSSDNTSAHQSFSNAISGNTSNIQTLTNQANAMVNVYGSKNILQNNLVSMSHDGVDFVVNEDKSITIDTNGQTVSVEQNGVALCNFVSEFSGDFILSHGNATLPSELKLMMEDATAHEWSVAPQTVSMVKGHTYWVWIIYNAGLNIAQASAKTIYPMLSDARIIDGYYEPYAMTNREMTPYVQAISNPNLLDNPWFTINQRGITSWSNENGGITADRWTHDGNATGSIANGVYTCNVPTYQNWEDDRIIPLLGKTVTLSWILSDGSIGFETKTLPPALTSEFVWTFTNPYVVVALKSGNRSQVARINAGVAIKAVKLELGSVSTLAQDTAPNYQQELAKCQRYFVRYARKSGGGRGFLGMFFQNSSTTNLIVELPTSMRATPTVTLSSEILVETASGDVPVSAIGSVVPNNLNDKIVLTSLTMGSSQTAGTVGIVKIAGSAYIDFSADL